MTLRKIHHTISFGITIAMLLAAIGISIAYRRLTPVLMVMGIYVVVYTSLMFVLRWRVPQHLRTRPAMPVEFLELRRLGPISPAARELLMNGKFVKEGEFRNHRHVLHLIERSFPGGVWRCHAEESAGEIIAWSVVFQSIASPVLDWGESTGSVGFLISPS